MLQADHMHSLVIKRATVMSYDIQKGWLRVGAAAMPIECVQTSGQALFENPIHCGLRALRVLFQKYSHCTSEEAGVLVQVG